MGGGLRLAPLFLKDIMTDLSLVLKEEIWKEFKKRYDAVVLITYKSITDLDSDIGIDYYGGKALCAGLSEVAKIKMLKSLEDSLNEKPSC